MLNVWIILLMLVLFVWLVSRLFVSMKIGVFGLLDVCMVLIVVVVVLLLNSYLVRIVLKVWFCSVLMNGVRLLNVVVVKFCCLR